MVSVRKSHHMTETNFEQWLASLELSEAKNQALEALWHQVKEHFADQEECESKSFEMVEILAALNLDKDSLVAAFLCPLYEYNCLTMEYIEEHFNRQIFLLCKGVCQMEAIKALQQTQSNPLAVNQIDNIRRMLLAMVEDVRAVVIKLAERLCYLRIVKNADEEVRVLAAKETANIYAPLANRLGIGQLKWELEDIAFRYLHPDVYSKIAKLLDEKRIDREQYMVEFVGDLNQKIKDADISGTVYGRPKHIYSIWKKMQQKELDFEQLFDVRAVRVIVDQLQDCYGALGIVHTNWKHLPNEFDDYVATPKPNGYQSIHTVVLGPQGKSVEVQIRTQQMHDDAELGVAAHWRYKEGSAGGKGGGFDEKIGWLRKILQWQEDISESGELIEELRSQVFEDRIYVFTPNGDVIDLPAGATPLDFAYYIHSNVGHCCIGAKVFGRIVPFTHKLQTGDQVEVLTSKKPNPSRDWLNPSLNYIHTARARAKVQHFFKSQDRDKHVLQGKELLEGELAKLQLAKVDLKEAAKRFNVSQVEDLYAAIGSGNARLQQVVNYLTQQDEKHRPVADIDPQSLVKPESTAKPAVDSNGITVSGVGNLLTHIAKCCHPVPGDEISGFITQGRGISVHREDCEQLKNALKQQPEREVEVQWGDQSKQSYQVGVQVVASDRQGLVRDISTIIANERVSIVGLESHSDRHKQTTSMSIKMEIGNSEVLTRLMAKLMQLDDVHDVKRL
ncbi:GTP diphosphokinase [Thalassomonas viridans]|uniref:GTP pyrophosphokinase n=1 Tax=Thalassomonas viridans TaxID=137584 RepID=A0AAE9Z4C4_9GAMM|nr:GTP diphosphokinase [Thalassomonas viridans]WDE06378.1 GTP diphosphokinase [Thalassomonas viridans]